MEESSLTQEPLLLPSIKQRVLISLGLGLASALLLAVIELLLPSLHFAASWLVGLLLGPLLIALWRRASCLTDVVFFSVGVVAGGASSILAIAGCRVLANVAPEVTRLARGCTIDYLRGGMFANAYGILVCTWLFGWGAFRWMTWGSDRRARRARQWQERFGGKRDAHP